MAADLPPSSSVHALSFSAASLPISLPTAELPVKVNLSSSGLAVSARPVSGPPGTTDSTPSGRPASANTSASALVDSGVSAAGLSTIGAAGQQRGAELVGRQEQRHVPRHDGADDADRFAPDQCLAVDAVADVAPGELVGGAGVELQRGERGAVLHHVDDHGGLAGLELQQMLEQIGAVLEQLHHPADHRRALGRRGAGPGTLVERLAGGRAGGVDIGLGGQRHLTDLLARWPARTPRSRRRSTAPPTCRR